MEKRSITPTRSKAVHGSYLSLTASNVTKAGNAQSMHTVQTTQRLLTATGQ